MKYTAADAKSFYLYLIPILLSRTQMTMLSSFVSMFCLTWILILFWSSRVSGIALTASTTACALCESIIWFTPSIDFSERIGYNTSVPAPLIDLVRLALTFCGDYVRAILYATEKRRLVVCFTNWSYSAAYEALKLLLSKRFEVTRA